MARPLRLEFEGALYHVLSRGERRDTIFREDADQLHFLDGIARTVSKHDVCIHAYVLMPNHFHLLVETPHANLCRSMQHLNTAYANWFKRKYDVVGSVFQGRYKSLLIEDTRYLLRVSLYIHLNPVRAGLAGRPEDYRWSSCGAYVGKRSAPDWLTMDLLLGTLSRKHTAYQQALQDALSPDHAISREEISGRHGVLGSEAFTAGVLRRMGGGWTQESCRELPDARAMIRVRWEELKEWIMKTWNVGEGAFFMKRVGSEYRKLLLYGAKMHTEMRLKEIGVHLGMDYTAVSQACARCEREIRENERLRKMVQVMEKWMESRKRGSEG